MATLPELEAKYKITNFPLLLNSGFFFFSGHLVTIFSYDYSVGIVLTGVLFFFFGHSLFHVELGLAWIAMIGAMLLVLLSGIHNFDHVLEKVEFGTLMFFASLFILMETIAELGLIDWIAVQIEGLIALVPEGKARLFLATFLLLWVSGIASALIDNIPYTATLTPVIVKLSLGSLQLPLTPLVWALVFGACLGGNGTLIGASANVVAVGMAEKAGISISFTEFTKIGFPITLLLLFVSMIYLFVFHVAISWW
eukprot:TRINITY_DN3647_c0_g3_i7.p1 TRINITY_DN3647_c0_g3~~TRINITY_DN3647_c0_g3_i7.p1  ORF type:complete len:265 (+),score=60.65 TRINITY_DN3647_c0_g3_i7:37-795(+)